MEFVFKHIWLLFMISVVANALILKYRAGKYIAQKPELKEGYDKLFKGILIYGNIPWVIMMIGNLSGKTRFVFEYFQPREMNPIVLVFHFSIVVIWILSIWWIYFQDGANFIETHPGLFKKKGFGGNTDLTAKEVKLFFPLALLGGVGGIVAMWVVDFPKLPFPVG